MSIGVEAVHIASVLGDRGTVFACGAEKRLLPFLKEKTVTLGLNSILIYKQQLADVKLSVAIVIN